MDVGFLPPLRPSGFPDFLFCVPSLWEEFPLKAGVSEAIEESSGCGLVAALGGAFVLVDSILLLFVFYVRKKNYFYFFPSNDQVETISSMLFY